MDSKRALPVEDNVYLGILGDGWVNFAHDENMGKWRTCHTTDKEGFTVRRDKRCARFSIGFIVRRIILQTKVERKRVQFMIVKAHIEVVGTVYY